MSGDIFKSQRKRRRWFVGFEIAEGNWALTKKAQRSAEKRILLIESENIVVEVKDPYCCDKAASATMKRIS